MVAVVIYVVDVLVSMVEIGKVMVHGGIVIVGVVEVDGSMVAVVIYVAVVRVSVVEVGIVMVLGGIVIEGGCSSGRWQYGCCCFLCCCCTCFSGRSRNSNGT